MPQVNEIVYLQQIEKDGVHTLYVRCREKSSVFTRVRFGEICFIGNIHFVPKNVFAL